jgi:hypothetical protein
MIFFATISAIGSPLVFEAQNWMAIAAGIVVIFAILVLARRNRG